MKRTALDKLGQTFAVLGEKSLNGDPVTFNGKFVVPIDEENTIVKILPTTELNGEMQIIQKAQEKGITFFAGGKITKYGPISFLFQEKLVVKKLPEDLPPSKGRSMNYWVRNTSSPEEDYIASRVIHDYGRDGYNEIRRFCKQYDIGNIYWRNIGFDSQTKKIKCFDFHSGLLRTQEGFLYNENGIPDNMA